MRTLLSLTLLPAALAGAACSSPSQASPGEPEAAALVDVPLATASSAVVPATVTVTGTIVADERSEIVPDTAGKVVAVLVDAGDRVAAGAPLVRLDTRTAALGAAEARAMLAAARAQRALADEECRRSQTLFDRGAIPRAAYDRDQLACANAAQQAAAAEARARLGTKAVADGVIRAPYAGVVTETWVSPGEWAAPGTRLVTLVDDDPLVAELHVPESAARLIAAGQAVELETVGAPDAPVTAAITWIGPELSPTSRALDVEAELPRGTGLRAGEFVEARIVIGQRELPAIPRAAVVHVGSTWRAFVVDDGALTERVVQLGPPAPGALVTIVRGVAAGERVAATITDAVTDGALVATP